MERNSGLTQLGFLIFSLICTIASAEDAKPLPKKPQRRVASVETRTSAARTRIRKGDVPTETPVELRIGLTAGFSGISASETDTAGNSTPAFSGNNFGLGGQIDLRALGYFGAEAEGYLGLGGSSTDDAGTTSVKRTTSGGTVTAKLQCPIVASRDVRILPKVGGGFGFSSFSVTADGTTTSDNSTRLSGGIGLAGVDVELASGWLFAADYLHSLGASGNTSTDSGTGTIVEALNGGSFDRLRIGVSYRIAPHFLVGAQYVRRTFTIDIPDTGAVTGTGSSGSSQTVLNQGLATFAFEL